MEIGDPPPEAPGPPPPPSEPPSGQPWPPPPQWPAHWPPPPTAPPPPPPPSAPWQPPSPVAWAPRGGGQLTGVGRFRPLSVGELLDGAFTLYRRNFVLLVSIVAVVQVPFAILQLIAYIAGNVGDRALTVQTSTGQTQLVTGNADVVIGYAAVVLLLQVFVVTPLLQAAVTRAVSDRYLDRPTSMRASYEAALRRLRSLLAYVGIIAGVTVGTVGVVAIIGVLTGGMGFLLLLGLVPLGIYAIVRLSVTAPAIVIERQSGVRGMRRSWHLLAGRWWRTAGILVIIGVLQYIITLLITIPAALLTAAMPSGAQHTGTQVASSVASVLVTPIQLITLTLLYYDARIRREAFDIEMLAASLGHSDAGA